MCPHWRSWQLDGKLLRFDRETGTNQLLSGSETAHFEQRAPRFMHVALTNDCNKNCAFCYRPTDLPSRWTFDELLALAHWAADWGVLELTFGGGEPLLFARFELLLARIWRETPLCPSFTTNGVALDAAFLRAIAGCYGQLQLSIYDDEQPLDKIALLTAEGARFGLNVLVTPERLRTLEIDVLRWYERGARDLLLLCYKGDDEALQLTPDDDRRLVASVRRLRQRYGETLTFKVDVCWRERLAGLPQLLDEPDCGAADSFVSVSSDKHVHPCSFHERCLPFTHFDDIERIYREFRQQRPRAAARGCGRPRGTC